VDIPESTPPHASPRFWRAIREVVTSASFVEKLLLLLVTALITGFLAPAILKTVDDRRSHTAAMLESRSKLLDDISDTVLTYETLVLDVSWFGTPDYADAELQTQAYQRYSAAVPSLITRWRVLMSRAGRVAPPSVAVDLQRLLDLALSSQDSPTVRLHREHASPILWNAQHAVNETQLGHCNEVLARIANAMQLPPSASQQRLSKQKDFP
jgi:hypothetical protein